MEIEIHSFESIKKRAECPWECKTAVISIGDVGCEPPELKHRPDYILRMEFDDIMPNELDEAGVNPNNMLCDSQALKIAKFVYEVKNRIALLICQCEYGESRSAGCAAAIRQHFYGDGIVIFADDRYYPNKLIYRKVLSALQKLDTE